MPPPDRPPPGRDTPTTPFTAHGTPAPRGDLADIQRELAAALAPGIQLLHPLARGGMGAVFLGRDPVLKRQVVIKVLAPELAHDAVARQRFAREAESAAAVSHPNIVSVFLVGELPASGTSYFVMQYVDGPTLAAACPAGTKVTQARCKRIVGEIASALGAAHARALIHRDIKPSNVMLEGDTERTVVLDFGISAAMTPRPASGEKLTAEGISIGTPEYMSPEQAAGDSVTDRSDVYSLGVVAFELLTGRPLFDEKTPFGLIASHIKDAAPSVAALRPDVDADFAALINRMLVKDPQARPSATEVARACAQAAQRIEWPPPGLERLRGWGVTTLRFAAAQLVALALFFIALGSMSLASGAGVGGILLLAALAVVCVVLIVGTMACAGNAIAVARWARKSGYPFSVSADVALDRHADTGALLSSAGRFASVTSDTTRTWFARRRAGAIAIVAGISLTNVLAALWSRGTLHTGAATAGSVVTFAEFVLIIGPGVLGWMVAAWLGRPERRARATSRVVVTGLKALKKEPVIPAELVTGWLGSAALSPPTAASGARRVLFHAPEWVLTLTSLIGLMGLVSAYIFVVLQSVLGVRTVNAARWRFDVRSEITATGGRDAWNSAIGRSAVPAGATTDSAAVRMLAAAGDAPVAALDGGLPWRALHALPGRLPDSVRRQLEASVADPALQAFRRVAAGAAPPPVWFARNGVLASGDLQRFGRRLNYLGRLGTRNAAAAALALDRGDRADAVLRAREIVAMGRVLSNDPAPGAYRIGLGLLRTGALLLGEIGIVTGTSGLSREGELLRLVVDRRGALNAMFDQFRVTAAAASPADSSFARMAADVRLLPSERWALARATVMGACVNLTELRSGVSPLRFGTLALAARGLVDIPRSDEWIQRLRTGLDALASGADDPSGPKVSGPPSLLGASWARAQTCESHF